MSNWTPVTPKSGGLVHITSLTDPHRTQCGKVCSGWKVALDHVDCQKCKETVAYPTKGKKKKA